MTVRQAILMSVTLLVLSLNPAAAQDDGLAGDLATAEAFVKICSDHQPDRAEMYRATLGPPFNCVSVDAGRNERARTTATYRSQFDVISGEMTRMPKEQIQSFCESLLQKHC